LACKEGDDVKQKPDEFGWCDLHEESVSEGKYRWKGCWSCRHFGEGKSYPYISVYEASSELGVSQSTVRRWIKNRKLEGELFIQGRHTGLLPSPKKYHIKEESLRNLKLKTKKS